MLKKARVRSQVRTHLDVSRQQPLSCGMEATMPLSQLLQQCSPAALMTQFLSFLPDSHWQSRELMKQRTAGCGGWTPSCISRLRRAPPGTDWKLQRGSPTLTAATRLSAAKHVHYTTELQWEEVLENLDLQPSNAANSLWDECAARCCFSEIKVYGKLAVTVLPYRWAHFIQLLPLDISSTAESSINSPFKTSFRLTIHDRKKRINMFLAADESQCRPSFYIFVTLCLGKLCHVLTGVCLCLTQWHVLPFRSL